MPEQHLKIPFSQTAPMTAYRAAEGLMNLMGKAAPVSVVDIDDTHTIVKVKFEIETEFTLPEVECPIYGPEWVRWPIQKGDYGVVISSNYYLGGISGLGGGKATLDQHANLSTLVFYPLGNSNWSETDDPRKVVLYGPDGVRLRNGDNTARVDVGVGELHLDIGETDTDTPIRRHMDEEGILDEAFGHRIEITQQGIALTHALGWGIIIDAAGIHFNGPFGSMHLGNVMSIYANQVTLSASESIDILSPSNVITGGPTYINEREFLLHTHGDVQPGGGSTGDVN